ncbi:hypothetical protein KUV73_18125 [Mameliella alba]|nr:hypothetical protein [Mameliella alba]MBY6171073.1 hypothetical protein [Mameliella alba]MBY6176297.1 hypothetical protein [Mameliella alba]
MVVSKQGFLGKLGGGQSRADAMQVHEDLLKTAQDALMSDDFSGYCACFQYPFRMICSDAVHLIAGDCHMRPVFDAVRQRMLHLDLQTYLANCVSGWFYDGQTIVAAHKTRMVTGAVLVGAPIPSVAILRRAEGLWRISDLWNARPSHFGTSFPGVERDARQLPTLAGMEAEALRFLQEGTDRGA